MASQPAAPDHPGGPPDGLSSIGRRAILVDLDGPLTRLFPDPAHLELAEELAGRLATATGEEVRGATDHVQLLRATAIDAPEHLHDVLARATAAEIAAARQAGPARGAADLLGRAREAGYAVAVVSNNDERAVWSALENCGLADLVDHVAARTVDNVQRLKPAPDLLLDALNELDAEAGGSVLLGDTVGDMEAAAAAGVRAIGISGDPRRAEALAAAGAVAVVDDAGQAVPLIVAAPPDPPSEARPPSEPEPQPRPDRQP